VPRNIFTQALQFMVKVLGEVAGFIADTYRAAMIAASQVSQVKHKVAKGLFRPTALVAGPGKY